MARVRRTAVYSVLLPVVVGYTLMQFVVAFPWDASNGRIHPLLALLPLGIVLVLGIILWRPTHPPRPVVRCHSCRAQMKSGTDLLMCLMKATAIWCPECSGHKGQYLLGVPADQDKENKAAVV